MGLRFYTPRFEVGGGATATTIATLSEVAVRYSIVGDWRRSWEVAVTSVGKEAAEDSRGSLWR